MSVAPVACHRGTLARFTRRQLLDIAWKIGTAAVVLPRVSETVFAQLPFSSYPFTLGVASGDPWPDGVVLWTRLAPDPLNGSGGMPMANVEVGWEVATDRTFRSVVQKGAAVARPELGHSVHVELTGLDAGREYFYRFRAGSETSPVGRTKTAPAPDAPVGQVRFAVCGCAHYEHGYFTAYRHIAAEGFDFIFHTGDYIYEGRANAGQNPTRVREHVGHEIYTVEDYRRRYALYKLDPDLKAAHASAPFIVTHDDHEVDNDYAGAISEQDTPPEVFLLRRAAAYQAYYEMMPLRAAQLPSGPDQKLYRQFRFGRLLELNALDTRQYRSDQGCGAGSTNGCDEIRSPDHTMLGVEQERWLFERLDASEATWTLLGQQVPTFTRDYVGTAPEARFQMDKWDGYPAARDRLFARIVEAGIRNPVVLSGDVHVHYAAELRRDFADPESPVIGTELTNTSIASNGDGSDVAGGWDVLQRHNPHLRYHSARRGYIACTVTPTLLRADFRIIDRVSVPGEPDHSGGVWVTEAGRPGLQRES